MLRSAELTVAKSDITEKVFHHGGTLFFKYAAFIFDLVIVAVFNVEDIVAGTYGSALWLVCSKINFPYSGLDYCAGTHRAGL